MMRNHFCCSYSGGRFLAHSFNKSIFVYSTVNSMVHQKTKREWEYKQCYFIFTKRIQVFTYGSLSISSVFILLNCTLLLLDFRIWRKSHKLQTLVSGF